jgi:DNA-binding YbaB/EbfC family protein
MKLPKHLGVGNMMRQAQEAMERAKNLESELAAERFTVDKGPVKAEFSGTGEIQSIKIDRSVVDPEDVEALEDLVLAAVREGFSRASEAREAKVREIMPNVPGLEI